MEADLFQEIFDVLETSNAKLHLPIRYGSPITKIVWSSFDYTCGPQLRFVWQPRYAEPLLVISDEQQIDDSGSDRITSSSKQTNEEFQYDDAIGMTTSYDLEEHAQNRMCTSSTSWLASRNNVREEDQAAGTSTLRSSSVDNTTITLQNEGKAPSCDEASATTTANEKRAPSYLTDEDDGHSSYTNVSDESPKPEDDEARGNPDGPLRSGPMITSCVDSGITGTISMHSDLSSCRSPKPTAAAINNSTTVLCCEPIDEIASSCSDPSDYDAVGVAEEEEEDDEMADKSESHVGHNTNSDDSAHLIDCVGKHATASFLNASSNIVGLSMLGASLDYSGAVSDEAESKTLQEMSAEKADTSAASQISDEEFVAKFALSEQIFSIQFDSNPVIPKISVVPNRRLFLCSYLFCARNDTKSMMAFTVVMNEDAEEWFYARERVFEAIFVDAIPRFKASLLVEDTAEVIFRVTSEFIDFFNLCGTLERFPLFESSSLWKIDLSKSHLMDDYMDKGELRFLYKALTGALMCQGYAVVIGNEPIAVEKMMTTLALFLQPAQRLLCLKPHAFQYSPYLRIQGLRRPEAEELYIAAAQAHWPVCFIDADRKWVSTSGTYFEHRDRKQNAQFSHLAQIFKEAGGELDAEEEHAAKCAPIISPTLIEADPYLSNMLDAFFLLAQDQAERLAFIDHLHMNLDYKARALVQTVKELSEPAKNFKENSTSSKWSLSMVRRLLNLTTDSTFSLVLARADLLTPSFAEFVYQTTVGSSSSTRR